MTWILLMLLTSTYEGISGFRILDKDSTWKEANGTCTLATPSINFTRKGMFVHINSTEDGVYWVGYRKVRQLFKYIGCVRESDVTQNKSTHLTLRSSAGIHGLCFSACKTRLIGIKDQHCYCLTTRPEVNSIQAKCATYSKIPIGGESSVSLFSNDTVPLKNITNVRSTSPMCVAVNRRSFLLKKCTDKLQPKCQTKSIPNEHQPKYSWKESCDICSKQYSNGSATQSLLDKNIKDTNYIGDSNNMRWTSMFLSKSVIRKSGESGTATTYGQIYNSNGKMELSFVAHARKNKALCTDPDTTTAKTTSIDDRRIVTVVTTDVKTVQTTSIADSTTVTVVSKTAPVIQNKLSNYENENNDTGIGKILLYIFVPLVVAGIAVTVVAVIFYRKRAKSTTPRQKPALSRENSEVQDAYEETGYAYSVPLDTLESKQRQSSNPNEEDTYDVIGATGTVRDVCNHTESDNVYNKLNTLSDDTYDHTNLTNATRTVKSGKTSRINDDVMYSTSQTRDESYDTTIPKQREPVVTENVYSHANNDETYSQTSRTANSKSSATDNIYD